MSKLLYTNKKAILKFIGKIYFILVNRNFNCKGELTSKNSNELVFLVSIVSYTQFVYIYIFLHFTLIFYTYLFLEEAF